VLTQHNNGERTGANLNEVILTPSNVNTRHFGMLFRRVVDDQIYGQPLVVANVKLRGSTHDLVYVTTVNNSVYAFDANDPYASEPLWHVNFGTPPNVYDGKYNCTDMNGNMGIIGTPVIDAQAGTLYVVAATRIGSGFLQRLHAWAASTDATTYIVKRSTKNAGPLEIIARGLTSTTFIDMTASNGMTYQYTVNAVNSNGESAPSSDATVFLPNPPLPISALPPGPGRDITVRVCSGCHSPGLVANEHLSPQEWHDLVRLMAAQGAVATDNELNQITAYLSRSFPNQARKQVSTRKEDK
jgi:mono/diheme cytochrome c family protein